MSEEKRVGLVSCPAPKALEGAGHETRVGLVRQNQWYIVY